MVKINHYCSKVGSIIFQSLKDETLFNRSVSLSGSVLKSEEIITNVNHVGLCIGEQHVIEATRKSGIIKRRLNDFLSAGNYNVVATIKDAQLIETAIQRAKSCLGLPYNHSFYPDAKGLYCSQLITYAFKTALGKDYFQQYPMNFCDPATKRVLAYWIEYYRQLKKDIPHGLLGSHPQQLLRQTHLFQMIQLLE